VEEEGKIACDQFAGAFFVATTLLIVIRGADLLWLRGRIAYIVSCATPKSRRAAEDLSIVSVDCWRPIRIFAESVESIVSSRVRETMTSVSLRCIITLILFYIGDVIIYKGKTMVFVII
jgi:hypothetical protein